MEIMTVGSDIVECVRIREMIERHGEQFLRRVYSDRELSHCQSARNSTELFAERWAAKEAALKCLGGSARTAERTDVEVRVEPDGRATLLLYAAARDRAEEAGITKLHVTLAHCRAYATAMVIAER